ncbi:Na(+) H(+) antiporter subunit D [Halalkalibacter wakoensis JCM 9140]|uniref:Na(+) H(+) antiporter subunit D n=1 Tax=Halalkalibacter wakoensis JCM 9140 TaxID=1236970 RepID=W4Q5W9_9BACI|nr:Na+/H+ antiporter subunit D [Halalkalibacter wakoensis]GAE27098.1 Na(+) H(+) antiporter subunit D [Halalkalibacter wakoensis JCM 9140]
MNNLIILPILIPFIIGTVLILFSKQHTLQRVISGITAIGMLIVSIYVAVFVYQNGVTVLELGNWSAPFGIVLVADMFATVMVALSGLIGVVCLFFAFQTISPQREKFFFYPFYFFLLAGVNGAFLTGDLFNLFVFFEVMLISSYVLVVMGGTKFQLRESFKYVAINVFASILFIVAIAYIYAVTGTLNMAHIAERVTLLEQTGVLNVIAVVLFSVFAMKGALFPLYFWLPRAYFGPPTAITALFGGLLTKVGIYAIIRTFTLMFTHDPGFTHNLLLVIGGLTMVIGGLGAVSNFDFKMILSYHIISQIGYMIMGIGLYSQLALAAAIFYIAHNIIVKSALFLFAGATQAVTGTTKLKEMGGVLKTHPYLAWMFFISALAIAGIPPLSGFFSKFPLVIAGFEGGNYVITAVALATGMLTLFSMIKIMMYVYWGEQKHTEEQAKKKIGHLLLPIVPLVALAIILGIAAEPVITYLLLVSEQILDPSIYIESVLKE